jgi:hypothetical protein
MKAPSNQGYQPSSTIMERTTVRGQEIEIN